MSEYLQEVRGLTRRWMIRALREPMSLLFSLIHPLLWLILFGHLFEKATLIPGFETTNYISFMTAGVVVMTVLNTGLAGGMEILFDREVGFLERLLVAPIRRSSLILSRFLFVSFVTALQILIVFLVSYFFGVRPVTGPLGVLVMIVIGLMFGIGLVAISLALAFSMRSHGGFFAMMSFVTLPLLFISSALVPLETMPPWLNLLARCNPMTYAIEGVRELIMVGWRGEKMLMIFMILLLFDGVCLWGGSRVFRRNLD